MNFEVIPIWTISFTEKQATAISNAVRDRKISQGPIVAELELALANKFNAKFCVCTSSGTSALMMAMIALNIRPGSTVVVPDRTWIATAHAAKILGANIVVCPSSDRSPVLDAPSLKKIIEQKPSAVLPVFLNGRNIPQYSELRKTAKNIGVPLIVDAAQALGSSSEDGVQIGADEQFACFSLSMSKIISSGQGGFIFTNNQDTSDRLKKIRTHGLENVLELADWSMLGGNFRYTDIAASLVLDQLDMFEDRRRKCLEIYRYYLEGLSTVGECLPLKVNVSKGELPIYIEYLVEKRDELVNFLKSKGIESRKFYPDISTAHYLFGGKRSQTETKFAKSGLYLPSGPDLTVENVRRVVLSIKEFYHLH
jgi:perosamine synthetase